MSLVPHMHDIHTVHPGSHGASILRISAPRPPPIRTLQHASQLLGGWFHRSSLSLTYLLIRESIGRLDWVPRGDLLAVSDENQCCN